MIKVGQRYQESLSQRTFTILEIKGNKSKIKYTGSGAIYWIDNKMITGEDPIDIKYALVPNTYESFTDKCELATETDLENHKDCNTIYEAYLNTDRLVFPTHTNRMKAFKTAIDFAKDCAKRRGGRDWKDYYKYIIDYVRTQVY